MKVLRAIGSTWYAKCFEPLPARSTPPDRQSMEQTLHALVGILQKAVPTIVIVILLHQYLKAMLFGPLQKTLKQRDELTAGAKKAAEASLAAAEAKTAQYEDKLRDARSEVYKQQEETRKQWLTDQASQLADARAKQDQAVKAAKAEIAAEAAAARATLEEAAAGLADQIAAAILTRRAA